MAKTAMKIKQQRKAEILHKRVQLAAESVAVHMHT